MFEFCASPDQLETLRWFSCYLTSGKHLTFYFSFIVVFVLLVLAAPSALLFGLISATASRSHNIIIRSIGRTYIAMVRGVPDIAFFLFVPIALDQAFEYIRHKTKCPDITDPVRQGNDFVVCEVAKLPLSSAPQNMHEIYGFLLALLAYAIIFGAFAGNTLFGAMQAVPKGQLETAEAYGMSQRQVFRRILLPQMWVYALPGLSNLWMILIKATPLLFLLGVEDIVYWARELGGAKGSIFTYPHPDWRAWYFAGLLVFYLVFTGVSEWALGKLMTRVNYARTQTARKPKNPKPAGAAA
ncbi:MAG: ABC transporter permease subunit [Alphaproteobacteria bacterium]|nr:ABC transporter permease subunit [Alphaproteobacteria bacterium]